MRIDKTMYKEYIEPSDVSNTIAKLGSMDEATLISKTEKDGKVSSLTVMNIDGYYYLFVKAKGKQQRLYIRNNGIVPLTNYVFTMPEIVPKHITKYLYDKKFIMAIRKYIEEAA